MPAMMKPMARVVVNLTVLWVPRAMYNRCTEHNDYFPEHDDVSKHHADC